MSANNTAVPALEAELEGDVRVDCYVRSSVPAAVSERLTALLERLQTLAETDAIADVQVSQWPAEHAIGETDQPTREELVAEFDEWATEHGYSLEPGFCRQQIDLSPFGIDDPSETIRVPLVALAFYDADDAGNADETVQGVVPCTKSDQDDGKRTYTVDGWLTTVERHASETSPNGTQTDQRALLEGSR
ncbi:HTH domain-containing protein [Natrinema sp. HArc-T2]|uniref:HTH domain-containing protein n=1 Tax=Natrinema sp. HArc-T2 TaxID=3242701 RepID=UPI00359DBC08